MVISAISPGFTPPVFIQPLPPTHGLEVQQPFNTALASTLNRITAAPTPLPAVSTQTQLINSLEQALFNQWVTSLQSVSPSALGTAFDNTLAPSLGITTTSANEVSALRFDANSPQSLLFTARLASLFNTMDLLGGDTGQGTSLGSLLDILA